jgi:hypothetical protein
MKKEEIERLERIRVQMLAIVDRNIEDALEKRVMRGILAMMQDAHKEYKIKEMLQEGIRSSECRQAVELEFQPVKQALERVHGRALDQMLDEMLSSMPAPKFEN